MRRLNFGRIAAAAVLAIGGTFGAAPRSVPATVNTVNANGSKDQSAPATPSVASPAVSQIKLRGHGYVTQHPIWIGIQKRGNRRNRSRFNYNR